MNIQEAVKQTLKEDGYIQRSNSEEWVAYGLFIKPTNTPECCIAFVKKEDKQAPRWNPCADDLMADDWEVIK